MKPPTLLVFLLTLTPCIPSSVIHIIRRQQADPPVLLSCGIIITENYVGTTRNPLMSYMISELCAMPATNMEEIQHNFVKAFCTKIRTVYFASEVDFVLMRLDRPLKFFYKVNPAMIPAVKSITKPFDMTKNCKVLYNERGENGFMEKQQLEDATIDLGSNKKPEMEVTLKESQQFCGPDSGLPVYCEFAVIGIMVFDKDTKCANFKKVKALKLYSSAVQNLLEEHMDASRD